VDDKAAMGLVPNDLPIPVGRSAEAVPHKVIFFHCPPRVGTLHYSVKTEFSVEYV